MLLKELLKILPGTQKCKIVYSENEELFEVKGSASLIINSYDYLLDQPVVVAYAGREVGYINICL